MQPKTTLTKEDYQKAAKLLSCDVRVIQAFAQVESSGKGFLADGRLVIRFEGHWFQSYTNGRYDQSHPTISHRYDPTGKYNKGVASDYKRFAIAMQLDAQAALKSCSIGVFQIMGFNHRQAGYVTVNAFWDAMKEGVDKHLMAFCRFCISKGIEDELRLAIHPDEKVRKAAMDRAFYIYNGQNFRQWKYDARFWKEMEKLS